MSNRIKKRESSFTQVSNSFLRDRNISFKAKGLFCYMFSMSEDWNFTIRSIANQQKDGESSIISAIKELKEYGYISYQKHSDGSGTYFLDDEPKLENPNLENPNLGKSTRIKKTELDKNKNLSEYKEKNIKKEKPKPKSKKDLVIDIIKEIDLNLVNKKSLNEWLEFKNWNYKKAGITKLVNMLSKYSFEVQQEIVDKSIMNNYQGLFEPKQNNKPQQTYKTKDQLRNEDIDNYFAMKNQNNEAIETEIL